MSNISSFRDSPIWKRCMYDLRDHCTCHEPLSIIWLCTRCKITTIVSHKKLTSGLSRKIGRNIGKWDLSASSTLFPQKGNISSLFFNLPTISLFLWCSCWCPWRCVCCFAAAPSTASIRSWETKKVKIFPPFFHSSLLYRRFKTRVLYTSAPPSETVLQHQRNTAVHCSTLKHTSAASLAAYLIVWQTITITNARRRVFWSIVTVSRYDSIYATANVESGDTMSLKLCIATFPYTRGWFQPKYHAKSHLNHPHGHPTNPQIT